MAVYSLVRILTITALVGACPLTAPTYYYTNTLTHGRGPVPPSPFPSPMSLLSFYNLLQK